MAKAEYGTTVLAESETPESVEGNQYFPRDSVDMSKLSHSDTKYTCPWKGDAEYFNLEIDGETVKDVAWSYPAPKDAAKNITGHLAFDRSKGVEIG